MILRQYLHTDPVIAASYLFGCAGHGVGAVIDPVGSPVPYVDAAASANFLAGRLGDAWGRKRVLVAGWLVGVPVPFLVIWAPSWSWIVVANVLLGINQGLAWSTTVIMKIDLVGSRQRGFAMGLNEFAGYLAVALSALATGYIAQAYGLRPAPFYLGIACAAAGLALSLLFVRDTQRHVTLETDQDDSPRPSSRELFARTAWTDPALSSASQAGLVNNLNDGLAWGLFPLYFAAAGLDVARIGVLAFTYPAVWGTMQLWTGSLSDRWGRKHLIAGGMLVQGGRDRAGRRLLAMDRYGGIARGGHRHGLPHAPRRCGRRGAPTLAGRCGRHLSPLAGQRLHRRRAARGRAGGCRRDGVGDRRGGPADRRLRTAGARANA